MIGQLETFVKQLNEELTNYLKSSKNAPKGKNMPNTIRTIVWVIQSENTVRKKILISFRKFRLFYPQLNSILSYDICIFFNKYLVLIGLI